MIRDITVCLHLFPGGGVLKFCLYGGVPHRLLKADFLYTFFQRKLRPIDIPICRKKHPISSQNEPNLYIFGCFLGENFKTKIAEKAPLNRGTYPYTMKQGESPGVIIPPREWKCAFRLGT